MLRSAFLFSVVGLFFSSISFAVVDKENEFRQKFAQAQSLAAQGQIVKAVSAYQAIIRSNPIFPEAYNNLAALYLRQGKPKEAKHILEQGLHANIGYGVLYESLTAINVAMAREAYSKALQIDLIASPISIASLSLPKNKAQTRKNTIRISKVEKPVVVEKVAIKEKVIAQVNPALKIKRVTRSQVEEGNSQSVEKVLHAWAAAWSAQAVDIYLSFYHNKYKPRNGMSQKNWIQSRKYRLTKPRWIKISLLDLKIKKQGKRQAVVNFKQVYKSNSFNDMSYKQIVLINTNSGWRIFRENNI